MTTTAPAANAAPSSEIPVASSASSNTPLTKEERKKRYEQLRQKLGRSKLEVTNGDPTLHYAWIDNTDKGEMIRLQSLGYFIVREAQATEVLKGKAKAKVNASGLHEDGTYVIGDVILMACPIEVWEFVQLNIEERHEELMGAAVEDFKNEAAKSGVPTFEPNKR